MNDWKKEIKRAKITIETNREEIQHLTHGDKEALDAIESLSGRKHELQEQRNKLLRQVTLVSLAMQNQLPTGYETTA